MSQYIRVLKPVSAVGAGGEVGFVVPPGKCLGMYIIFCNKISCQKKKDLINVLLFFFFFFIQKQSNWHYSLTSLSISFWMLCAS